jgi:hypothetical protein
MKNLINTIHGRINRRANQANKIKCYGFDAPTKGIFYWSFVNEVAVFEDLILVRFNKSAEIFYN